MDQGTEINESEFSLRLGLKEERGIQEKRRERTKWESNSWPFSVTYRG